MKGGFLIVLSIFVVLFSCHKKTNAELEHFYNRQYEYLGLFGTASDYYVWSYPVADKMGQFTHGLQCYYSAVGFQDEGIRSLSLNSRKITATALPFEPVAERLAKSDDGSALLAFVGLVATSSAAGAAGKSCLVAYAAATAASQGTLVSLLPTAALWCGIIGAGVGTATNKVVDVAINQLSNAQKKKFLTRIESSKPSELTNISHKQMMQLIEAVEYVHENGPRSTTLCKSLSSIIPK